MRDFNRAIATSQIEEEPGIRKASMAPHLLLWLFGTRIKLDNAAVVSGSALVLIERNHTLKDKKIGDNRALPKSRYEPLLQFSGYAGFDQLIEPFFMRGTADSHVPFVCCWGHSCLDRLLHHISVAS